MQPKSYSVYIRPALIGVGIFIFIKIFSSCDSKNPLQVVRSVKTTKGDISVQVDSTGEVKPYNRVEMKPPIAGRVEEVLVKEGDPVEQGQIMAWMSSTERAALLDAARAQGKEILERWQDAYKPAPLIAPLNGTVIVRNVEPGQSVTTADPIVVLADRLIVQALVDETDLAKIKVGQSTRVRLDAYPDVKIEGKVDHIGYESQLVNNVNMYAVDILSEKVPDNFRSGMTATVTFLVTDIHDAVLVPSEAIAEWPRHIPKPHDADFAVYKKTLSGKLKPFPVKIGETDGRMTQILEGFKAGTEVVVVRKKESSARGAFSPMGNRRPGGSSGGGRQGA